MDGRDQQELSDAALEKEIEAALGVDPSPEFLPKVRARIASEGVSRGWLWSGPWHWAGAGAAVTLVVIAGLWTLRDPAPHPRDARVVNTPPVEASSRAPEVLEASADTPKPERAAVVRTARSPRRPVEARPEVVVSPDEAAALRQLVVAIAARQVAAADIPALGAESAPLPPLEEIVLEPIKLSPMAGLGSE